MKKPKALKAKAKGKAKQSVPPGKLTKRIEDSAGGAAYPMPPLRSLGSFKPKMSQRARKRMANYSL